MKQLKEQVLEKIVENFLDDDFIINPDKLAQYLVEMVQRIEKLEPKEKSGEKLSSCCGAKIALSISTLKGRRRICNKCGKQD